MNASHPLQPGSRVMTLLLAVITVFFVGYGTLGGGGASLFFALLGAMGTWRHYAVGRRRRSQGGLDLIGTEDAAGV
ncbi:MAG: hypothetical protein AAF624_05715 [Bacteroidota bacterium]